MKKYLFLILAVAFLLLSHNVLAQSGCCSHHGGVSRCDTSIGRQVCMDGTYSPSCICRCDSCGDPPPPPTNYEKQVKDKINLVKKDYADNHEGFRENLIPNIAFIVGSNVSIDKIGYFVYTMLPDIIPSECNISNGLPDLSCTPGATDSRVSEDNIKETICVSGYTSTVRPSTSVTNKIKTERMQAYGDSDVPSNYELDHLIPLELGGSPDSVQNLWPEPYVAEWGARKKDVVENFLRSQVCRGAMNLDEAQKEIVNNWIDVYNNR